MSQTIQTQTSPTHVQTGYCTNVHAGRDLATVLENLRTHSLPARDSLVGSRRHANEANPTGGDGVDETLGLGLWFSEVSVREALRPENLETLKQFIEEERIQIYTLNGFPQMDFHQPVVKHQVYLPTWHDRSRLDYTLKLIDLLDQILPDGEMGSISTMPIAWQVPHLTADQADAVAKNWLEVAQYLHALRERTGREILVAVEPEPGCMLTDSKGFRDFYTKEFLTRLPSEKERDIARRHITLCHDVCHAAVMYEDQASELQASFDEGIRVGKVQISSAVSIDWDSLDSVNREVAWSQLKRFVEGRYLHQVHVKDREPGTQASGGGEARYHMLDDLPEAFREHDVAPKTGEWRVHFHVPVYLDNIGMIRSTQEEIYKTVDLLLPKVGSSSFPTGHFEVETYAWTVLPTDLAVGSLSEGISKELQWFEGVLRARVT